VGNNRRKVTSWEKEERFSHRDEAVGDVCTSAIVSCPSAQRDGLVGTSASMPPFFFSCFAPIFPQLPVTERCNFRHALQPHSCFFFLWPAGNEALIVLSASLKHAAVLTESEVWLKISLFCHFICAWLTSIKFPILQTTIFHRAEWSSSACFNLLKVTVCGAVAFSLACLTGSLYLFVRATALFA